MMQLSVLPNGLCVASRPMPAVETVAVGLFADAYARNLAAARARDEIADGPDEPRAWALIGMSVFLGMRYGIWDRDLTPAEVAETAIALVSEGLRKR